MITTIRSSRKLTENVRSGRAGFTLAEVLIAVVIGSMLLGGILGSYVFIAKSCASINDYTELDIQARGDRDLQPGGSGSFGYFGFQFIRHDPDRPRVWR